MVDEQEETGFTVGVKMPQFMETAPAAWFSILEANFHIKKITTEETKFFHLIAALPPEVVQKLQKQLPDRNYTETKQVVVNIYEETKPEMFEKLIRQTTMSGRPSHFLQELCTLATKVGGVCDDLVRHKFINALPATVAPVVAAQRTLTLQQLGSLADELTPLFDKTNTVMKVSNSYGMNSNDQTQRKYENRRNSSCPTGVMPYHPDQRPKICRAHIYYGNKARTCKPWCRFPGDRNKFKFLPNSRQTSPARSTSSRSEN